MRGGNQVAGIRAFAIIAAMVWPAAAMAFDVHRTAKGALVRFADRPVAIYVLYTGAPIGTTPNALNKAVQGAIDTWSAAAGVKLPFQYGGLVAAPARYDITVQFEANFDTTTGDVLGRTVRKGDPDGKLLRADIYLNSRDVQWSAAQPKGNTQVSADLQGVITHQLGHAMGLDHSRAIDASMYFYGTSAAIRSLDDDDIRGARFLWPKDAKRPAASGQCDPCDSDSDCLGGGTCLAWPDGSRYCALPCSIDDDCQIGSSCGAYGSGAAGGVACLPNEAHCKADAAFVAIGGACASDTACGDGFCMPGGEVGFCTSTCTHCAAPGQCANTNIGGLCLIAGGGAIGAPCYVPGDCQSFVCDPSIFGGGRCSKACGSGCPSGFGCDDKQTCTPIKNAAGLPTGWPCKSGFDCAGGKCLATPGGRFAKVCTQACKIATDCPTGTGCAQADADNSFCLPVAGSAAVAGAPCPANGYCGASMQCGEGLLPSIGACRNLCDPFSADNPCLSGEVCAFSATSPKKGICQPALGGSRPWGAECTAADPCRADLVCTVADAKAADAKTTGVCRADCNPTSAAGCDKTEKCVTIAGSKERGVCLAGDSSLESAAAIPPNPVRATNFAAVAIKLPKTVKASLWKYTPPPAAPAADSGCATGRSANGSAWWLVAGAAWWLGRKRRRNAY